MASEPDRIVHLSDEAHAMATEHCRKHGISLKSFVGALILQGTGALGSRKTYHHEEANKSRNPEG